MKKTLSAMPLTIMSVFFIGQVINAQMKSNIDDRSLQPGLEKIIYLSGTIKDEEGKENVLLNDINIKAVRQFSQSFSQVQDVKWQIIKEGFVAIFTEDSIKTHVFYNKKGNYMNMIRYYNENKLPAYIRHIVRSNYYDYSIYYITEVEYESTLSYFIKLEDKMCWKTIKVWDGEMQIVDVIKKAG